MRHYTDDEKRKATGLYFDENLTSQQVVDRLGYPTRQCLESWLRKDKRYGDGTQPSELIEGSEGCSNVRIQVWGPYHASTSTYTA